MSDSAREVQRDGTCPDCGRFAQIECSVHGPLDGDPWAEVERLREALREIASVPVACPPDPVAMGQMRQIASAALSDERQSP